MRWLWPPILCAILCATFHASAQELKEMQLSDVPEAEQKPVVVLDPNEAILVVYSTIPDLSFDSNLGIKDKTQPYEGVHWVHLNPGTSMVIFKAPGYLSLEQKFYIPPKEARQVKITPKATAAPESFGTVATAQTDTTAQLDKIHLRNGSILEGKVKVVKTDLVEFVEKQSDLLYEFKKSEIQAIVLSTGQTISFADEPVPAKPQPPPGRRMLIRNQGAPNKSDELIWIIVIVILVLSASLSASQ